MASRDPEQESCAAAGGEAAALVDDVDGIPCSKIQVRKFEHRPKPPLSILCSSPNWTGCSGGSGLVRNMPARRVLALRVRQEEGAGAHRAGHDHPSRRYLRPLGPLRLWKNYASLLHSRETGKFQR